MINNGPFCKGIESDKENIFESELWKKQWMYNGAFLKSLSIYVKVKQFSYSYVQ